MKLSIAKGLRCPACFFPLRVREDHVVDDVVLEGDLQCIHCEREYPIHDGAAFLAVMDAAWPTILKELINRREIIEEDLRRPAEPTAQRQRKAEQDAMIRTLTDECFDAALKRLPTERPLRLIDCGAGMFETSAEFAARGIEVAATDTEISMVRYANFQGALHGDPQPFEINGRTYHIRDPHGHPHYFSRVVADIQRLPFKDAFFDVAFCRAMLHHVDRLGDAIREMARLVRPEDSIIICAEPIRSILDPEAEYHEDTVDREEGMNEQAPTLLEYRKPLTEVAEPLLIQYWPSEPRRRTMRLFRAVHYKYHKHLWPGETLSNWKWVKLLPWAGGVNFYGTRSKLKVEYPTLIKDRSVEPIAPIARVYVDYDDVKTIEGLRAGTEELKALRRRLLASRAEEFPTELRPGATQGLALEAGWGTTEGSGARKFRRVGRRATVFLQAPPKARTLWIRYGFPKAKEVPFRLVLNGEEKTLEPQPKGKWLVASVPLKSNDGPALLQVEFRCELEGNAQGPAIERLSVR